LGERTGYAHGTPSWVDLAAADVGAAASFYKEVFGWDATEVPTGDQPGTYMMFTKNGKVVAGMGEAPSDGSAPPVWSTYIAVDNVDAVVERVSASGGSVIMSPMDAMGTGRMAFIADPTGAAVGLWQAGSHKGAELVNEHGTFTWNELLTDDADAAASFYKHVFDDRVETTDTPNGPYSTFWAEGNLQGHAAAGMMAKPPHAPGPNYWGVYFAVDDVDACVATASEHGAKVLAEPFDATGVGRIAMLQDPQGAVFSVMTYESPMD
jgi:predicted enzyme related to lactoylglutathione lyase